MKLIFDRIALQQVDKESSLTFTITVPDEVKLTKTVPKTRMIPQPSKHIYETENTIVPVAVTRNYEQKSTTEMKDTEVWAMNETTGEMEMTIQPRPIFVYVEGVFLKPTFENDIWIGIEETTQSTYQVMVDTVVQTVIKDEYESVPDLAESYDETIIITNHMDIAVAKFEYLTRLNGCTDAYADEFFEEDDLDLNVEGHRANTGMKIVDVLPHGFCQTKPITPSYPCRDFKLYHESDLQIAMYAVIRTVVDTAIPCDDGTTISVPIETISYGIPNVFTEGECSFGYDVVEFVLRFINNTDKVIKGSAYAIMYRKEVNNLGN